MKQSLITDRCGVESTPTVQRGRTFRGAQRGDGLYSSAAKNQGLSVGSYEHSSVGLK
jgi:hypothetical protein